MRDSCDTEDSGFNTDVQLPMIMAGCGGFVGVSPYRSGTSGISEWMLEELWMVDYLTQDPDFN